MDLATLIGLLLGFGALVLSVSLEGGHLSAFINVPAAVLVFGGTLGATLVCFPLAQVRQLPAIARHALLPPALDRARAINLMVGFAQKARREGILVLEEDVAHADNPLLQLGVQLAVDGTPQDVMREILETEVEAMAERHKQGEALFSTMGGFAPTLGIIGTVMGLVHMLGTLNDPQGMGPAIASAFLATLYGVALANLVLLPLAHKLRRRSDEEVVFSQMLVEGILAIQSGDGPRTVEAKMRAFLSPVQKASARVRER
ncbi:MAG: flagellar motor protein [Armatimonadetes bacterium]|nr:flagellar motor protein [Armatimonadota bacterium]